MIEIDKIKSQASRALVTALCEHGISAEINEGVINFGEGTTPVLRVVDVKTDVHKSVSDSDLFISHISIDFALNPEFEDTCFQDCATGWASSETAAIDSAINAWMTTTAPPVFSLLKCESVLGAEWFPSGDKLGITGWDVFSSSYMLRGNNEEIEQLKNHLATNSLVSQLNEEIFQAAKRELLNFVNLYVGFDGTTFHSECIVNGTLDENSSQRMQKIKWPLLTNFVSVRQFMVLIKPEIEAET